MHTHAHAHAQARGLYSITAKSQKSETFVYSFCRTLRVQRNYSARTCKHKLLLRARGSCPRNALMKRSGHVRFVSGRTETTQAQTGDLHLFESKTKPKSLKIPVKKKTIYHPGVLSSTQERKKALYRNRSQGPGAKLIYCHIAGVS